MAAEVNAHIEEIAARSQPEEGELWQFFCECWRCKEYVQLTLIDYEAVKRIGATVLLAGHFPADPGARGRLVRLLEPCAGMAAGSEGILLGRGADEVLVSFWDGGPLRIPCGAVVASTDASEETIR